MLVNHGLLGLKMHNHLNQQKIFEKINLTKQNLNSSLNYLEVEKIRLIEQNKIEEQ